MRIYYNLLLETELLLIIIIVIADMAVISVMIINIIAVYLSKKLSLLSMPLLLSLYLF